MPDTGPGRYGSMFNLPPARQLPQDGLLQLAKAMIKPTPNIGITKADWMDENPTIPAGYTYFGQFVNHDLSFDPTPLSDAELDPGALVDFRTPALDLDSVYGHGPDDQPYLYTGFKVGDQRTMRLRVGRPMQSGGAIVGTKNDLLRLSDGPPMLFNDDREGVALIGDQRNDENRIVSQIHTAIIAFHNKVVADKALVEAFGGDVSNDVAWFRAAARLVRWHYQWVVVHDFLDRLCEPGMKDEVLNAGGVPRLANYHKDKARYAYMPVEFTAAAFRFGHSMVRASYALNQYVGAAAERFPVFSHNTLSMAGFSGRLQDHWGADWGYFLEGDLAPKSSPGARVPQPSFRIDALLADPLADLPQYRKDGPPLMHLAFRNLDRGQMLRLPAGQDVARALGVVPLSDDILWDAGSMLLDVTRFDDNQRATFEAARAQRAQIKTDWVDGNDGILKGSTPLWYYILREAEYYGIAKDPREPGVGLGGQHLGPVGSRIVAQTLIGVLWRDRGSFLHASPAFTPMPQITGGASRFTLDRLFAYALT
jgi:hypothetical protein